MNRLIRIRKTKDAQGKEIQHALYDTGHSWAIHRWDDATDTNRLVEEIEYHGHADRRAARAMAMGALDSLHQQTRHELHGATFTDKHGITMHWAAGIGRYVTIPDND